MLSRLFLVLFFVMVSVIQAAGERISTKPEVQSELKTDERGLIYRGGVDMKPSGGSALPEVGIGAPVSIGCGKFDFGVNLRNTMTSEAIQDYVSTLGENALAASPWLLLEYINPTMADALKHIQGISYQRLPLLYNDCETIRAKGTEMIQKLKSASDANKISAEGEGGDIEASMKRIKKSADLSGLLDYYGNPIGSREHKLIEEGLEWAQAEEEIIELAGLIAGEIIISGKSEEQSSVERIYPTEGLNAHFLETKRDISKKIVELVEKKRHNEIITDEELKEVSTESVPLTNLILRQWVNMDSGSYGIEIGKYSSAAAMAKLLNSAYLLIDNLITASTNIYKSDTEKELIVAMSKEVSLRMASLKKLRNEETMLASTITDSLDRETDDVLMEFEKEINRPQPTLTEQLEAEGFW